MDLLGTKGGLALEGVGGGLEGELGGLGGDFEDAFLSLFDLRGTNGGEVDLARFEGETERRN